MANTHETLTGLFSATADAIRSKTGGTGAIVADKFPEAIAGISVGIDTSDATASTGEILSGKTAYVNGAKVTGSMANNGAVSQAINAGGSYTIPAGYHNGSGKVTGNTLASQTSATAAAGDIRSGKTAWVNGSKVTGTMVQKEIVCGQATEVSAYTLTIPNASKYKNIVLFLDNLYDVSNMSTNDRMVSAWIMDKTQHIQISKSSNNQAIQHRIYDDGSLFSISGNTVTSNIYLIAWPNQNFYWRYVMWN